MIPASYFLIVSVGLFAFGFAVLITKKNLISMLMGVELMLNAVNINFVVFSRQSAEAYDGHLLSLFIMIVAAAEVAVALAIILKLREEHKTINPDKMDQLKY